MSAADFKIVQKTVPTFYFIGVTTGSSSIMKIFPLWTRELGFPDVVIEGVDLKLHDDPGNYRQAVAQIKYDPRSLGALVTTHKIDLYNAARDLFDEVGSYARIGQEVSAIGKDGDKLIGDAVDPTTSGTTLNEILGANYFSRTGGEVLCFGSGGAATAIALHFSTREHAADAPRRMVVTDINQGRLDKLRVMVDQLGTAMRLETIPNGDAAANDALMASMPPSSLIINATGMGKDRPGSPITDAGQFPQNAIAWELNYRGELRFMHQALAQKDARHLTVTDGWRYFLHGWTQVISYVYHTPIEGALFERLADIAGRMR
jgi:shikimate 5-dehydrogenase